jgi:hypothetical protein
MFYVCWYSDEWRQEVFASCMEAVKFFTLLEAHGWAWQMSDCSFFIYE